MPRKRKNRMSEQSIRCRAAKIVNADGMMRCKSPNLWEVQSQPSPDERHIVHVTEKGLVCDCKYGEK